MKIYIRNMACESCKVVVKETLEKLRLKPVKVELGEAEIKEELLPATKEKLRKEIQKAGLELIDTKSGVIIEKIRKAIVDYVNATKRPSVNFSDFLSERLKYDYNYLSNIFTEIEANTITHYMNGIKMEKAKEMLLLDDYSVSEVAEKLFYSNVSHFSAQFKKVTGFAPSYFKKLKERRRKTIQEITSTK